MGADKILTSDTKSGTQADPVTGTDLSADKRGMDVASYSAPLAKRIDEASATVTYVGYAAIGSSNASAVWQIFKLSVSGAVTSVTWADSNANFDNVWDDRASLTYG